MTFEPLVHPTGWRSPAPFSPAVRAGGFIFVSGHVPIDPETSEVDGSDTATQTRRTLLNIQRTLGLAGVGLDHVVKVTVFLTRIGDFEQMNQVYRQFFSDPLPARSTVEVSALARPAFLVEIEAVALA